MTIEISDQNPRSIKAVEIAAGAAQWLKVRTRDGLKLYGVPSSCQQGRFYLVTTDRCDCPDAQRHPNQACKHVLGVRLHVALVRGAKHVSPRRVEWQSRQSTSGEVVHLPRPATEPDDKFWDRFAD